MQDLQNIAKEQEIKCHVMAKAYSIWLKQLFPANIILVVGAAIFALIAGSTHLFKIGAYDYSWIAGFLGILSAIFTIIHTKLNCDEHQAQCKILSRKFEAMAEGYLTLRTYTDEKYYREKLQEMDQQFIKLLAESSAKPSDKALREAKSFYS